MVEAVVWRVEVWQLSDANRRMKVQGGPEPESGSCEGGSWSRQNLGGSGAGLEGLMAGEALLSGSVCPSCKESDVEMSVTHWELCSEG